MQRTSYSLAAILEILAQATAAATAAEAAQALAEAAAADVGNSQFKLDYWPSATNNQPDVALLDASLRIIWSAQTEMARVDALEALPSVTYKLDYWPGEATGGRWKLYADGGIFSSPEAASGADASTLASTRNSTSKAGVPNELTTRVSCWAFEGQSLAIQGGTYTPTIYNTSALYPGKVVIPSVGMWPNTQVWTTVKDAVDEYYASNVSQGSTSAGATQSVVVSFLNRMYALIYADTALATLHLGVVNGAGGTSIQDLAPGSSVAEAALADMQRGRDWAEAQGYTIYMPACIWTHGNEDFLTMSGPQYKAFLRARQRWHTNAARRIFGQAEEVIYYIEQCTSARTSLGDVSEIIQAQLDLCNESPEQFRFLGVSYDLTHPDGTHMDSANYYIRDTRYAEVVYRDLFCGGQRPFAVTSAWWTNATTIRCRVEVPVPPLVIDYGNNSSTVTITIASPGVVSWTAHGLENGTVIVLSTTGALPTGLTAGVPYYIVNKATDTFQLALTSGGAAINTSGSQSGTHTAKVNGDGFQFDDGSGSPPYVTGITIADTGEASGSGNDPYRRALVDVTLSATPASTGRKRLLIAQMGGPSAAQGSKAGARSTLRDSATGTSSINRSGSVATYNLYNWHARQEIVLP